MAAERCDTESAAGQSHDGSTAAPSTPRQRAAAGLPVQQGQTPTPNPNPHQDAPQQHAEGVGVHVVCQRGGGGVEAFGGHVGGLHGRSGLGGGG